MNTEENIETLDDDMTETEVNNNPEQVDNVVVPEPISVNDMINNVAPTNLENTNIENFGQDGINVDSLNQNVNAPTSFGEIGGSEEFNNIGMVPPNSNATEKPKKKSNKTLIVVLAIILIAAIGYGVYYYLHMGNKGNQLKLKTVKVEINSTISTNINDYIESGKADSSCTSNFNEVLINKAGTYDYKIICNSGTYKGTIIVVDEASPRVITKSAVVKVGAAIKPDDFIESCSSGSECEYSFVDSNEVTNLTKQVGTHEVSINVKDPDTGNSKVVKAYLIVIDKDITHNIVCNSASITSNDSHTYVIKDTLGIYHNGTEFVFAGAATRDYTITYSSSEAFNTDKGKIDKDGYLKLDFAEGKASYDSEKQTITITKLLTIDELKSEFSDFSTSYSSVRNSYTNDKVREFECITNSVKTN